ncbi:response regulator transcription factor [Geodermatophilus sp. YIM 151500]|uniref:response regulator n=1 Tax=Geodermatophilus sp. YIM 151500 TaxID=2984531 RepID=UPI0021E43265|nr:response regulator transcription factor [Geodermatophilus sp. YIM 151500]MCV2490215.1 response regulator transcription factor [Geodermatophilus sp. YIM 151500]
MTVRVLVVDDHPLYRDGLVTALASLTGVEVVGEAGDGAAAVERAVELAPDVVVMDLNLPGLNGIEATRAIVARAPETAVLVLTMLEGEEPVFAAMRAGARGYLLKGADRREIARALETVAHGEVVFSAGIAARVLAWFAGGSTRPPAPFPGLTDREREVLDLVAHGLTNPAIAQRLSLSEKTVRNHVSNVFGKLHVTDRGEAVARARDAGLGAG